MKKNVGTLDAYLRLTAGFTALGIGIIRGSKRKVLLGSVKIAEGFTRWCPMLALLGINTLNEDILPCESLHSESIKDIT